MQAIYFQANIMLQLSYIRTRRAQVLVQAHEKERQYLLLHPFPLLAYAPLFHKALTST